MSGVKLTFDKGRLAAAIRNVMKATKKTEAAVVNRASKNISFRAASFTPKASASEINAGLRNDKIILKLAIIACRNKYGTGKGAWGNKQEAQAKIKEEASRIMAKRKRGIGALRAGWIPAIQQLGGNYRGARLNAGSTAAKGTATKATIENLSSVIRNTVMTRNARGTQMGAGDIALAEHALLRAVEFVTDDMEGYAIQQITKTLMQQSD